MGLFKKDKPEPVTWAGQTASDVANDDRAGSLAGGCRHDKGTQTFKAQRTENRVTFKEYHCGNCDSDYISIA